MCVLFCWRTILRRVFQVMLVADSALWLAVCVAVRWRRHLTSSLLLGSRFLVRWLLGLRRLLVLLFVELIHILKTVLSVLIWVVIMPLDWSRCADLLDGTLLWGLEGVLCLLADLRVLAHPHVVRTSGSWCAHWAVICLRLPLLIMAKRRPRLCVLQRFLDWSFLSVGLMLSVSWSLLSALSDSRCSIAVGFLLLFLQLVLVMDRCSCRSWVVAAFVVGLSSTLPRLPQLVDPAFLWLGVQCCLLVDLGVALKSLLAAVAISVWQHLASFVGSTTQHLFLLSETSICVIVRLWQSVGQVKQILGHPNGAQKVHLRLLVEKEVFWKQFLALLFHNWHFQDLFAARSHLWGHLHHELYGLSEFTRKYCGYLRIDASQHFLVESLHVLGSERWLEGDAFVEDAAQGPDIWFVVVWLVLPNFWWSVIWCSCLCVKQAFFGNFWNIHIS